MASYHAPQEWEDWNQWLAAGLHGRSRWRLSLILTGMLFASGRRCVSSWLRAAGIGHDYQDYYYLLQSIGKTWRELGRRVLLLVLKKVLRKEDRVLFAIDDSPTKRYGPHVEGAGIHHDPTPGPTGAAFCYGHVWVTLAVIARHPLWGTIGLPIWSWLYVRQKDIAKLAEEYAWSFQTKLEQAADLVLSAVETLQHTGKQIWVVADGAYTKQPFVRPVLELRVTLVGRLRKDAALFDLPPREKTVRQGRKRIYGKNRISLIKRAAHPRGWREVVCHVYGREEIKLMKTFLATHRTFGRTIRVVIVKEKTGPQFFYCTDLNAEAGLIIETFADRAAIEQVFHDVKEVWGSGQQQVRNLWSSIGAWNLNLWMHTLVELFCWDRRGEDLVDRKDSPWDDPARRPSHADRRKALQGECLAGELNWSELPPAIGEKIRQVLQRLLRLAI